LTVFVPRGAEVPGWTIKGEAQHFSGDDLYVYIDGGAEIYNEYGFRQVLAQDYENGAKKGITLEIYEMADPAAAYGIFSFKASGKGQPSGIGAESEFEDYYLHFWKGPYLVTVTGFESSPEYRDGVIAIARATAARIKETADRPAFLAALPPEWIGPGLKYIRGVLGLYNLYPFFTHDVLKFREAASRPIEGGRIFIFGYPDAAEAKTRLSEAGAAMTAAGSGYRDVKISPDGHLEAADAKGNIIQARVIGKNIRLVLSPKASSIAEDFLKRIR